MLSRGLRYSPFITMLFAGIASAQNPARPPSDQTAAPPADPLASFEAHTFESSTGSLQYRLLKPTPSADPADDGYPLILFLHGAGERGADNHRQLIHGGRLFASDEFRGRYPAFLIAPQCPEGKKWVEVPWDAKQHAMPEDPGDTMKAVFELMDSLQKEHPIDPKRIYAIGLSMGGFGTWDIVSRKPELLAAAVPICGGGDPARAEVCKSVPVWAFHGQIDLVVTPTRSRQMITAIKAVGGRPVYTEYEGVGHDSWTQTFENRLMWDWMFTQHK